MNLSRPLRRALRRLLPYDIDNISMDPMSRQLQLLLRSLLLLLRNFFVLAKTTSLRDDFAKFHHDHTQHRSSDISSRISFSLHREGVETKLFSSLAHHSVWKLLKKVSFSNIASEASYVYFRNLLIIDWIDKDADGWTAFVYACEYGRQDVVKLLLDYWGKTKYLLK